jgi:hypothetical protein
MIHKARKDQSSQCWEAKGGKACGAFAACVQFRRGRIVLRAKRDAACGKLAKSLL